MKKKTVEDFSNIFSKMIFQHNTETVPFLKLIRSRSVKIRSQRILLDVDRLENGNSDRVWNIEEYLTEFLLLNKFILDLLDKVEINSCLELVRTKDKSNIIIGASMLYSLIEAKKEEIKSKLNE